MLAGEGGGFLAVGRLPRPVELDTRVWPRLGWRCSRGAHRKRKNTTAPESVAERKNISEISCVSRYVTEWNIGGTMIFSGQGQR